MRVVSKASGRSINDAAYIGRGNEHAECDIVITQLNIIHDIAREGEIPDHVPQRKGGTQRITEYIPADRPLRSVRCVSPPSVLNPSYKGIAPHSYGTFSKRDELTVFAEAIQSAEKMQGILDVAQSDYDVVLMHGGKQKELHLWINANSKHGMFTYVSDTGQGYKLTEQSTRKLYDLIWGLKYHPDQAAANGDVVNLHGKLLNPDIWTKFAANVKAGAKDEVQVVQYTIEGNPIFNNLSFDGETIRNIYDTTRDPHGTPMKRYAFCKALEEKKSDRGTINVLASCGDGEAKEGWFSLLIP